MIKNLLLTATMVLSCTSAYAQVEQEFTTIVKQIQRDTGTVQHMYDQNPNDSAESPLGVGPEGSVYQLWVLKQDTAEATLLDEKTVSSYHPQASMVLSSKDSYARVFRTRVDQPFDISYTISGLLPPGDGVPDAATRVMLKHDMYQYGKGEYSLTNSAKLTETLTYLNLNMDGKTESRFSTIPTPHTELSGEEVFTVYSLPDLGISDTSQLDKIRLQVWPIATAILTGIDTSVEYTEAPSIKVKYSELYPDSVTKIVAYKGKPNDLITSSEVAILSAATVSDVKPISKSFEITDAGDYIQDDGEYTIEVWHETPFGTDRLFRTYPLIIDKAISVRGNVISAE